MNGSGKALILVEKRTYKPAGWSKVKEQMMDARFTTLRIYINGAQPRVFNRGSGREIVKASKRATQSYRFSVLSTAVFK